MQVDLIAQGSGGDTLETVLQGIAKGGNFDRLDVAVAYATKQGLLTLEKALGGFPPKSRWVVGLDDAITQPEALSYLFTLPGAKLRLATLAPQRRFHPKLYCVRLSGDPAVGVSAIGSGNMTLHGLRHNGEAAVLLTAESEVDVKALKKQWKALWILGDEATQAALDAYAPRYKKAKASRKKMAAAGVAPPVPEDDEPLVVISPVDGNPDTAMHGWLEVGRATQGKEVEIPKPLLPYFRLPANTNSALVKFRLPGGLTRQLRMIDRKGNAMWRIEFTAETIQALAGRASFYLPDGNRRSERVLLFKHLSGHEIEVSAVVLDDAKYAQLVENSKDAGFLKRTISGPGGRSYGVF